MKWCACQRTGDVIWKWREAQIASRPRVACVCARERLQNDSLSVETTRRLRPGTYPHTCVSSVDSETVGKDTLTICKYGVSTRVEAMFVPVFGSRFEPSTVDECMI